MSFRRTERMRAASAALAVGVALFVMSTGSCGNATAPENAPANHTVQHGGAFHAPGASNATANCVECHGADLRGGTNGEPSCYRCHGKKWSG